MPHVQATAIILGDSVSHGWASEHVVAQSSIVADATVTPAPFVGGNAHMAAGSSLTATATVALNVTTRVLGDSATFGWASSQVVVETFIVADSDALANTGFQVSAALVAGSSVDAPADIHTPVSANLVADSAYTDSAVSLVRGNSTISAGASVFYSAAITASGSVTIVPGGLVFAYLSGHDGGQAIVADATPVVLVLMSGRDGGKAFVVDNIDSFLSGSTTGFATLSAPVLSVHIFLSGSASGFSSVRDSAPLPIFGTGGGSAFLQVVTVLPPVNSVPVPLPSPFARKCRHRNFDIWESVWNGTYQRRKEEEAEGEFDPDSIGCSCDSSCGCPRGGNVAANRCQTKQFRWGYLFTYKDLALCLSDPSRNPISPYEVTYTMYQVLHGGAVVQTGPEGKRPVRQRVGLYYAVGMAGENGQPGNWIIRWCYSQSFGGAYTTVDYSFQVVDAISKPILGDPTCRQQKYGWD